MDGRVNLMAITDSPYTNPDALRSLYVNPKNVLRALEEIAGDQQQEGFGSAPPVAVPVSTVGGALGGFADGTGKEIQPGDGGGGEFEIT